MYLITRDVPSLLLHAYFDLFMKVIFQSVQTETNFLTSAITMNKDKFNLKSLGGSV